MDEEAVLAPPTGQLEGRERCDYCGGPCYEKRYPLPSRAKWKAGFCMVECAAGWARHVLVNNWYYRVENLKRLTKRSHINIPPYKIGEMRYHDREGTITQEDILRHRLTGLDPWNTQLATIELQR